MASSLWIILLNINIMMNYILRRTLMATHSRRVPQRRHIQWAAYYPDETTMVVVLGSALGVSLFRLFQLELRTREQQHQLKSKEDALMKREKSYNDIEKELRANSDKLLQKYNKLRDEKKRMEASIIDRGKAGEEVLSILLSDCKAQDIIKDYKLQYEVSPGKIPDALVEVVDDVCLVVDSKAPSNPPNDLDEQSRREYVDKLKSHVRQLSNKQYNSTTEQPKMTLSFPLFTLMMLPGEGYLQVAYEQGKDTYGLNKFARDRNVLILGPHGLRSSLQLVKLWLDEQAANDRLKDAQVHENIVELLQPLWVESLLPFIKKSGNLLESVVSTWNSKVDSIISFDKALRSKEILAISKARKTQLPKKVTLPKSIADK